MPSEVRVVEVDERSDGQRLDNFLLRELKGAPRSLIYRLLRKGSVRVNSGRAKPAQRLHPGDRVRIPPIRLGERGEPVPVNEDQTRKIENTIIYEDNRIIVLNKPSGLAVHGGSGISLGVIELLRAARPHVQGLELVHRLDRDTSGCLLVAKRRSVIKAFQQLQAQGLVEKRYLALLTGRLSGRGREVKAPLRKNVLRSGERVVRVDPDGKPAHTSFLVRQQWSDMTLVEARLRTGRTHQIRVHAAHLGHPILGDDKYGKPAGCEAARQGLGLKRLFLHASVLAIPWQEAGEPQRFECPLPKDLQKVLDRLGAAASCEAAPATQSQGS
jgi:23S rRNA pseudouridine955/2504/2580 synthase